MDTMERLYNSGGSHSPRAQLAAEWRDLKPALDRMVLAAQSMVEASKDIQPLWADERRKVDGARAALLEHTLDVLSDFLGDVLGPLHRRVYDAGLDPADFQADMSELRAVLSKPVCAKEAA